MVVTIRCPWWWWVSLPGPSCLSGPVRHVYPLVSRAGILVMTVRVSCRFGRCLRVVTTTSSGGAGIFGDDSPCFMPVRQVSDSRYHDFLRRSSQQFLLCSSRLARWSTLYFFCDRSLWWPSDGTSRCVLCYFCPVLDNPGTCRICGDLFVECVDSFSSVDSRLVCGTVLCVCVVSLFCLRPLRSWPFWSR